MKTYTYFEIEDFLSDDAFLAWTIGIRNESTLPLEEWIRENPQKQDLVYEAQQLAMAIQVKPHMDLSDEELHELIYLVQQKLEKKTRSFKRYFSWYYAAGIAIVLGVSSYWFLTLKKSTSYQVLVTQSNKSLVERINGTLKPLVVNLPDGSVVVLKQNSKVSYLKNFNGATREVFLEGEALFDVVRDPKQPFYVYANDLVTRVLGTSFIIRANQKNVTVSVKSGKVSVFTQKKIKKEADVVLMPNEEIVFTPEEDKLVKANISFPQMLIQKKVNASFDFSDAPLAKVFDHLKSIYGIDIIYDSEQLAKCPLTASFSVADKPLQDTLNIICKAIEAHYDILDGQVIVYGKGCKG
ncbi:MAG: FecR family protein [Siphonobacter sp.]